MYNKITIVGRLGHSPELKTSKDGNKYCQFTMAVDEGYGDRRVTDWFRVTAFKGTAENCAKYLQKGSLVLVSGSLHLNQYKGKDGSDKCSLEVSCDNVTFLSKREEQPQSNQYQNTVPQQNNDSYFSDGSALDSEIPF